jgi:hypothetical protein
MAHKLLISDVQYIENFEMRAEVMRLPNTEQSRT